MADTRGVVVVTTPIHAREPLDAATFARVRLRTIFECRKWDPQVGDVGVLCPFPLVIDAAAWRAIADAAEAMAREALAAERELLTRPDLVRKLGLPRAIVRCLRNVSPIEVDRLRVMRFDFHWTRDGWRISECNADVPGGWNEASGFAPLIAAHGDGLRVTGDPTDALVWRLQHALPPGATVALLHATAYTDDRQVMQFFADRMAPRGLTPLLIAPTQLDWIAGRAHHDGRLIDAMLRFFPAEWLPNLGAGRCWRPFFEQRAALACNPATALLIQSKRLPLVWDALRTPMDAWRQHLPDTRDPRRAPWRGDGDWLLKPALGRVGAGIAMRGVTSDKDARRIRRAAAWSPRCWVAQRRFDSVPIPTPIGDAHVCVGVFVVAGEAAGAYARLSRSPLIDHHAMDAALLIAQPVAPSRPSTSLTPALIGAADA